MSRLSIKNWAEFQHYKDRSPPWIKLHKSLLDNYDYQRLPIASRALAPMLWLLASESQDGTIEDDVGKLAFRLRQPEQEVRDGLEPLIHAGFLVSDSNVLAGCQQDACLETERETEREAKKIPPAKPTVSQGESKDSKSKPLQTFTAWLESVKSAGELPVPEDDPIFAYAEAANIPDDFLRIAWAAFRARYADDGKRYRDWRSVFRRSVREGWFKLWLHDGNGYKLTTTGQQAMNEFRAKQTKEAA